MIVETNIQILTWVMTTIGFIGFHFAGQRKWWAWYINLGCQILWATYALATGQLAFLAFAAAYFVIFARNAYKWTKEHLNVKRILKTMDETDSGTFDMPGGVKVTYNHVKPEEESNLVKHARRELELIGEDPEVIEWFVRVIKEFSSFGHSGGSAWATTSILEELLRYKPLTELTDDPEEWFYHDPVMWDGTNGVWQNKRDGRMFSSNRGQTYWCVDDGKDENGDPVKFYDSISKDEWKVEHAHVSE